MEKIFQNCVPFVKVVLWNADGRNIETSVWWL